MMITRRMDLPQRTMDLLVLRALALEPQYGWALSRRIHQVSGETLLIQQGSLYPSLHRLESRGWIKGKWVMTKNKHRVKYYEATGTGRKQLQDDKDSWEKLAAAIAEVQKTP
jgi:PadR family transcriptional regulator, regulatory protein PadR